MGVADWLRTLGLEQYEAAFRENGVTADVLGDLTAEDLRELGIAAVGHRRKLLVAIAKLRDDVASPQAVRSTDDHRASTSVAERRQITVLFCDIVGSTPLSIGLDPEELREILSTYQANVAAAVTAEQGYIARFVGDGVLAYFGWPNPDEAHAESAVRAGLAIVEALVPQRLSVRVGITTGLVVTGDLVGVGAAQTVTAVGETPNLAARLQGLAQPGSIVVSEATRMQVGKMFELEDLGLLPLKGFDRPVRAWRVLGKTEASSRSEVLYASALTPLIGRDEELGSLLRRWHESKVGEGRLVLLSGEPGIGKSRLLAALEEELSTEPHQSLRYFCSPLHQGSALHPIIARWEQEAGFTRTDSAEQRLRKLESVLTVAELPTEDVVLIAALLSVPIGDRYPQLDLSPQQRKGLTVSALLHALSARARSQPLLMLFEDAHWADPSSLELLDRLVDRLGNLPVLLAISYRPEFAAPWIGRAGARLIALSRLDHGESAMLAAQVATEGVLPPTILARIVAQADGVPLFIEELTKAVAEARTTGETATVLDMATQSQMAVPVTLHASLMARLDRLGSTKEVAQVGAVIGRTFDYELLAAVSGWNEVELDSALRRLVETGLVFARGVPPKSSYVFKHALVQDTAYDSLLRGPRKELHRKVAEALESRADGEEIRSELLAHHWSEAGEPRRAAQRWLQGARQTLGKLAPAEALVQCRRGLAELEHLPEDEWRWQTEVDLQLVAGNALMVTHGHAAPPTGTAFARAAKLCERLPSVKQRMDAQYGYWSHLMLRGELPRALGLAEDMLAADNRSDDPRWRLAGLRARGIVQFLLGHFDESIEDHQQYISLWAGGSSAEGLGLAHDPGSIGVHCYRSFSLTSAGKIAEARRHVTAAMQGARASGHHLIVAQAMFTEAVLEDNIGATEAARPMLERTLAYSVEHGVVYFKMFASTYLSTIFGHLGDVQSGLLRVREGIELARASGTDAFMPGFLVREGELLSLAGRLPEALARFAEAFALSEQTSSRWDEARNRRLFAKTLVLDGCPEAAEAELRRALTVAREQGARLHELEVACDFAPMLARNGQTGEARGLLERCLASFAQEDIIPTIVQAHEVLRQLNIRRA